MGLYETILVIALIIVITGGFIMMSKLPYPKRLYFKVGFFVLFILLIWMSAYRGDIFMKLILTFIGLMAIAGEYKVYREFKSKSKE